MAERLMDPRLFFNGKRRQRWIREAVVADWKEGIIPEEAVNLLLDETRKPNTDRHLRDFIWCDIAVHYPGILVSALGFNHGFSTGSVEWMAGSVLFHLFPKIGPGSMARTAYLAGRAIQERYFLEDRPPVMNGLTEMANLGVSLLPYVGNASVLVRMAMECPKIAGFLLHHSITSAVHLPMLGRFASKTDQLMLTTYNRLSRKHA